MKLYAASAQRFPDSFRHYWTLYAMLSRVCPTHSWQVPMPVSSERERSSLVFQVLDTISQISPQGLLQAE